MLWTYFVGPITDAVIDKLHAEVTSVLGEPPLHAGMIRGFDPGNGGKGFGCAWREDLAFGRGRPRSIDLAAWIAWSQPGYPPARPYCPAAFVGSWLQREASSPTPARWTLEPDGTFAAPDTPYTSASPGVCTAKAPSPAMHRYGLLIRRILRSSASTFRTLLLRSCDFSRRPGP